MSTLHSNWALSTNSSSPLEQLFKEGPSKAPCTETGVEPPYLAPDYWMTTGFPNTQIKT